MPLERMIAVGGGKDRELGRGAFHVLEKLLPANFFLLLPVIESSAKLIAKEKEK